MLYMPQVAMILNEKKNLKYCILNTALFGCVRSATVTAINTGEVWVKRADGNASKLFINQLQKGKYTIRHVPY